MLWTTLPTFWLMGYKLKHTFMCLAPGMLLHAAVWNALHPNMHSLPDIPISDGVPSSWLAWARSSKFFKFLYVNHEGHHVIGGKGNYNVCCPLTDHLVGTFIPEAQWRARAVDVRVVARRGVECRAADQKSRRARIFWFGR